MFTQLNNHISAAVLDRNGRKIGERDFVNMPFAHLFPQDEFVVIDWLANSIRERRRGTRPQAHGHPAAENAQDVRRHGAMDGVAQ
jgi:hypothetical protein